MTMTFALALRSILWEGRRWIETAAALFVIGLLWGLTMARTEPQQLLQLAQPVMQQFAGVGQEVMQASSPLQRGLIFFLYNGMRAILIVAGGLVGGLWPGLVMVGNGFALGMVIGLAGQLSPAAASPWQIFLGLAPHGIVEIPALFLASAWGMKVGMEWLLPGASGQRLAILRQSLREAGVVLVLVLILLLIAGMIEGNITLALVQSARNA